VKDLRFEPGKRTHVAGDGIVRFRAYECDKPIECAIEVAALNGLIGAQEHEGAGVLRLFDNSFNLIGAVIEDKLDAGKTEQDGSILLTLQDLMRYDD